MIYPKDFKKRALEIYPNDERLRIALDAGNDAVVNNALYTALELSIDYQTALRCSNIMEIWQIASNIKAKVDLFNDWRKLYNKAHINI